MSKKDNKNNDINKNEENINELSEFDHRVLGAKLDLFAFSDLVGKGLPLFTAKGATIRRVLERFIVDEEISRGYLHVVTPPLAKRELYEVSGHYAHYKDNMYPLMDLGDGEEMVLRPMACPHHFELYNSRPRSYRELPMRFAEMASYFRREFSGSLTGLIRVMMFTLSDAHIVCREDQLEEEFEGVVDLIKFAMGKLGLTDVISYRASLRDKSSDKYVNDDKMWEKSESILTNIMDKIGLKYQKSIGDAAFYGPKLDIQMRNAQGKEETVFTVQIDFCLPSRFKMKYINENGEKVQPIVIHRSSIGALERTIAFLLEYYKGALPLWLSPVQVKILSITDMQNDYAKDIDKILKSYRLRSEVDIRNEIFSRKLHEARDERTPYILIIGDKEKTNKVITVRNRDTGKQRTMPLEDFAKAASLEDTQKLLKLEI